MTRDHAIERFPQLCLARFEAHLKYRYERLRHASIYYDIGRWEPHPIEEGGEIDRTPAWTLSA